MKTDKSEVLRYLGYRNQSIEPELDRLIDDCMARSEAVAAPKTVYAQFGVIPGGPDTPAALRGTGLALPGGSMRDYLADCETVMLMAATLGIGADREIRRQGARDMTRSLAYDACFTALIEAVCDETEEEIRKIAAGQGYGVKYRYSPGYGDLPLEIQPEFLAVLNAQRKIGLTCTESLILMPSKSVTALVGFTKKEQRRDPAPCARCAARAACKFRKEGVFCGRRISEKAQ